MNAEHGPRAALSRLAHAALNRLGIEVRLIRNLRAAQERQWREQEFESWRALQPVDFPVILDIGANEGQFAELARRLWPRAKIHSFEPLPDIYALLQRKFADDSNVAAHNIGLSDRPGKQVMHRSDFSPSSSLLPMAELHRSEWPQSARQTETNVFLERLDDWAARALPDGISGLLTKIDVQGFESAVIDGGRETLRRSRYAVIEVSFRELYIGQPLFADIHARMRELGFSYCGSIEQYRNRSQDAILFADAIFENTENFPDHD